ncbi:SAM-dependent methyltransferase [Nesterenkonia sp. E16_7]|uniref:THUMP-like domain-containing protein n=1 Tax=unclassified Nesterenkonia TaxID=2629769 RepID=UPI001A90DDEC|nr:SAM-dependent methyltransferase [Nesterenkonia sp. E16_10]MBO0597581.1 SAM-dependent methyltransferase [Nesterenkonia sp. E16_7]
MSSPTADPLSPVLTPEGWELLNSLPPYDEESAFGLNLRLREAGHPPDRVAAALTQSRLRAAARKKFGEFAGRMLFTHEGLQQSTRLPVAARHAQRFRTAGLDRVIDLGCGLGGDAMAAASLGLAVTAVEADERIAAAATMNLHPFPEAAVEHGTAEDFAATFDLLGAGAPPGWGLWLDPARRDPHAAQDAASTGPSRLWDPESFSPPLSFVTALASTGAPMGVKLGPGLPHDLIPADCEAEWVSVDGDLVEVVLWFNALARPGVRRAATLLPGDGAAPVELISETDFGSGAQLEPEGRAGLSGVLHEPDPAVIRSGLVAELADALDAHLLDEHIAYFCAEEPVGDPAYRFSRQFRVLEVRPYNVKSLKAWVADSGVTTLEIKKRGVDVVPEQLRQQVLPKKRAKGPRHRATVVVTRLGEERVFAVVEPL